MKKIIPFQLAGKLLLAAFGLLAVFHLLVLFGAMPEGIVWGGRAAGSPGSLQRLETISLIVTLLFMLITAARLGYIRLGVFQKAVPALMWIIFAYTLLNLLGNLASGVRAETFIFAPITLVMALLVLRLAVERTGDS